MKKRIDIMLAEKKLVRSRTIAAELVRTGKVVVDGEIIEKPSITVSLDAEIKIIELPAFASRGGLKLARALDVFGVDVANRVVADIGASTGGFTDCVLQKGAKKVYAIDVGRDQLIPELREDSRVVAMEGTDVRSVEISEKVDLAVVDVSFISVKNIIPPLADLLKKDGEAIVLIKPQFEVGKGKLGKNGVVRDEKLRESVIEPVVLKAEESNLVLKAIVDSPILGGSGNKEFLAYFQKKL